MPIQSPLQQLENVEHNCTEEGCSERVHWKQFSFFMEFMCLECYAKKYASHIYCQEWMLFYTKTQGAVHYASFLSREPDFDKTSAVLVNFKQFDIEHPELNFVVTIANRGELSPYEFEDAQEFIKRAEQKASTYTPEILEAEQVLHALSRRKEEE